ncbi:mitochondrial import receptor subunit TOM20 homolog [Dromaius novaehollandiae]|uniref:mitochondrial import receptor subunit TOM20 homolog n=1 Tax=Dromaius novaehollandiae TaxID=8790 RepID=UPI00312004E7
MTPARKRGGVLPRAPLAPRCLRARRPAVRRGRRGRVGEARPDLPLSAPGKMMVGKTSAIAAGLCGALFIGYCIYFDRKRRSDPNFKNRLRERRKKQKLAKERAGLSKLPDLKDAEAVQKFFLEEIQLGEELLAQGEYEKGVDHLTNAIAVCGQPQQLLQVLQQTLPPPVFQMLLTKLPTISQRIVSAQCLAEDDVE